MTDTIMAQRADIHPEILPSPTDLAGELLAELARIRLQISTLEERRTELVAGAAARFADAGVEHYVIEGSVYSESPSIGARGVVWLEWWGHQHRLVRRFLRTGPNDDRRGPEASNYESEIRGSLGLFEVVAVDGENTLVVRVYDDPVEEVGHRKAIGRLRNRARAEDMRISVRDRTVSIVDPMGTVTHTGDVWSAWFWLEGVEFPTD